MLQGVLTSRNFAPRYYEKILVCVNVNIYSMGSPGYLFMVNWDKV